MAKVTGVQRQTKIAKEQETIHSSWSKILSDMTRETNLLIKYAPWKNDSFLSDKDFDAEDIQLLNEQFQVIYSGLQENLNKLTELASIPSEDPSVYKTNNDQYITDSGIDIVDFDKRYQS